MTRLAPRSRAEGGFTLIELLVVLAVLPIIVAALSIAIISMLNLQQGTSSSVGDSADAQTVSAYYEQDVQSASNITTSSSATQCGPGTQVLGLEWNQNQYGRLLRRGGSVPESLLGPPVLRFRTVATPTSSLATSRMTCPPDRSSRRSRPVSAAGTGKCGWTTAIGVSGVSLSVDQPGSQLHVHPLLCPEDSVSASQFDRRRVAERQLQLRNADDRHLRLDALLRGLLVLQLPVNLGAVPDDDRGDRQHAVHPVLLHPLERDAEHLHGTRVPRQLGSRLRSDGHPLSAPHLLRRADERGLPRQQRLLHGRPRRSRALRERGGLHGLGHHHEHQAPRLERATPRRAGSSSPATRSPPTPASR